MYTCTDYDATHVSNKLVQEQQKTEKVVECYKKKKNKNKKQKTNGLEHSTGKQVKLATGDSIMIRYEKWHPLKSLSQARTGQGSTLGEAHDIRDITT